MKRLYTVFEKRNGKWVRIADGAYTLATARKAYQNALLAPHFNPALGIRELRPVPREQGFIEKAELGLDRLEEQWAADWTEKFRKEGL